MKGRGEGLVHQEMGSPHTDSGNSHRYKTACKAEAVFTGSAMNNQVWMVAMRGNMIFLQLLLQSIKSRASFF